MMDWLSKTLQDIRASARSHVRSPEGKTIVCMGNDALVTKNFTILKESLRKDFRNYSFILRIQDICPIENHD